MDVIAELTSRIEDYRATNAKPCKSYATREAAEKATANMAHDAAVHFALDSAKITKPARYVVFFNEAWGRWVGAVDLTELMARPTSTGGYVGICSANGFFSY
jgi:hypothetical protein